MLAVSIVPIMRRVLVTLVFPQLRMRIERVSERVVRSPRFGGGDIGGRDVARIVLSLLDRPLISRRLSIRSLLFAHVLILPFTHTPWKGV